MATMTKPASCGTIEEIITEDGAQIQCEPFRGTPVLTVLVYSCVGTVILISKTDTNLSTSQSWLVRMSAC